MKQAIALLIIILCFIFVGCTKDENNEAKIIEGVQTELETTSEVELTLFGTEEVVNGCIEHYVAKVEDKYYIVSVKYVNHIVDVDVIKEI